MNPIDSLAADGCGYKQFSDLYFYSLPALFKAIDGS
jgi:hypothetical protein